MPQRIKVGRPRALIIASDQEVREEMRAFFEEKYWYVVQATTIEDARAYILLDRKVDARFNLIVVDDVIDDSGKDALFLLERLRRFQAFQHIYFALITSAERKEEVAERLARHNGHHFYQQRKVRGVCQEIQDAFSKGN